MKQDSAQMDDDEIDLARLWGLMLDNRWLIVSVTACVFVLAACYAWLATPVYRADALLQVEDKQGGVPGFAELSEMFVQENSAVAEIEILRSRMVLNDVIDQLRLDIQVAPDSMPFFRGPARIELGRLAGYADDELALAISELTVPRALVGEELLLVAGVESRYQLFHEDSLLLDGVAGEAASNSEQTLHLKVETLVAPPGTRFNVSKANRLAVIKSLQAGLSVAEQGKNTGMLRATFTGTSPARIVAILDAITESYLLQNIKRLSAEAENSLEFLDRQLPEMKAGLQDAEEKLNAYRLQSESVDLSLETASVLERVVELESKLNELSFKESEISRLYTSEHPAYQTLRQQRARLLEERDQLNQQIKTLPETQQEILRLTRDVQVNQEIYVQMLNKVQELRILKAGTVGNVRIIDGAMVDPEPVKPKKSLILALGLVLGGMLAVGYVLLRAAFHRGVRSPDELEQEGMPVYGVVPRSEVQIRNSDSVKRRRQLEPRALLSLENPADVAIEALRSVRTSLHFAMLDASNKVLMITGASPGVGKSFVAANLAVVLAQINHKVVLIDADMRRGLLHENFKANRDVGLSSFLAGQEDLTGVIQPTQISNLSFISRGTQPPNPAELLMRGSMTELIAALGKEYDMIIIDSPPVLAVTDATIIGQHAGTTLMVTRFQVSTVKEVMFAERRLVQSGVRIKGAILNCIEKQTGSDAAYYTYEYTSDTTESS